MRDAKLMGRLTASATHEMQNILATIRESAGLMSDILTMAGGEFAHAERFRKCLSVVNEQVERGMGLSENLNYCAHSPEPVSGGAEVNVAARSLVGLSRRLAARGRVELALLPARAGLRTALNAAETMELVALAMDCALPLMPQHSELRIAIEERGGEPVVRFIGPEGTALRATECYAELEGSAAALGARLEQNATDGGLEIVLPRPAE